MIAFARQSTRTAHDTGATELAKGNCVRSATRRRRQMGHIPVDITGNEEIQFAVSIVIAESGSGRPVPERDARSFGYVTKRPIVIVVVKAILSVVGDVDVGPAVIVVVADRDPKPPSLIGNPGLLSHVGKRAI